MNRLRVNAQIFFSVQECLFRVFLSFPSSNDIKLHSIGQIWAKILRTLGKVGPMLSGETRTKRKNITFQTKFWARGDAETYLHGTTLSDFTIACSKL